MTDRQADGWRHPGRHVARSVEARTPAELANLLTLDALIRTYGMNADELEDLMLRVRVLYRGGAATERQARLLSDLARSLDDLAMDACSVKPSDRPRPSS
jgi:sulfite reductase beta subunit-like hemoprotein